ncbi:subtype B tannase [Streptomyces sp. NPDC052309]|uniref:subtype B tannase n=1 Tax=Streptomyces sp. NPDC052309 TaxID=3155421 RepID=UPI003447D288
MKRRELAKVMAATTAVPSVAAAAGPASATARAGRRDPLAFDPDDHTTLTATVVTGDGEKTVTYRFHRAVPYVAEPVDLTHQTLNVSVPVAVDGKPVDAGRAPILLSNAVGGYMPSSTAGATGISTNRPNPPLALAAGCVVVEPGARGRTLVDTDGTHYGVAPAAVVDLKAAVRYLRHNEGRIPGNTDRIVATGVSAGGALTALLGATGDSPRYEAHLRALGAADASDAVFAAAPYCPITDLEHADMAYEWNWGGNPLPGGAQADQALSRELRARFAEYQASLRLSGGNGFGRLTARNYDTYLVRTHLEPSATRYLTALADDERERYLAANPWIHWTGGRASFTWADFLAHVGTRKKNVPSFDALDLSTPENNLFGHGTTGARHFTLWSLRRATGDNRARLDADLHDTLDLMNPMPSLARGNPHRARHWFIRVGTKDTDTSLTVVGNLAAALEHLGDDVDASMYWDGGHGVNLDAPDFIDWIGRVCR